LGDGMEGRVRAGLRCRQPGLTSSQPELTIWASWESNKARGRIGGCTRFRHGGWLSRVRR
jgi:hypothetical protein